MTTALIDSPRSDKGRRWKFTSGVLSWHPDDKVSHEQEEEVMNAFENVAFAGLEPDQRNILWVRHSHAGHHKLHFALTDRGHEWNFLAARSLRLVPPVLRNRQKDFDVFRDLYK